MKGSKRSTRNGNSLQKKRRSVGLRRRGRSVGLRRRGRSVGLRRRKGLRRFRMGQPAQSIGEVAVTEPESPEPEDSLRELGDSLSGKIYYRGDPDYEIHAYQYATSSHEHGFKPSAIVYVANDEDIKAVIRYANEEGVAIAVRSGGHSYSGSSSTTGRGVQIDMSGAEYDDDTCYPYSQVEFLETVDEGEGEDRGRLVRIGAGTPLYKLNEQLYKRGLFTVHG